MICTPVPDVTIVCATWNRYRYLEKGLPSLFEALSHDLVQEIILLDNASSDGTLDLLRTYESHPGVRIIAYPRNIRYKAFNKLFAMARGRIIIEFDDDVIEFPKGFDKVAMSYLESFPDYGYLSFDTIVNDLTDGHRGEFHFVDTRGDKTVEEGTSCGYLAAFRRRDYRLIRPFTLFFPFSIEHPQDWVISGLIKRVLHKRAGVIRGVKCLHACGPLYARLFGRTELDLQSFKAQHAVSREIAYREKLSRHPISHPSPQLM